MHIRKTLIVALILLAAVTTLAGAAECEIYEIVAGRLVSEAADLEIPETVAAILEAGDLYSLREAVVTRVAREECPSAHVMLTIVKALGKAALKGVATLVRYVI